jgi:hypothetical protein
MEAAGAEKAATPATSAEEGAAASDEALFKLVAKWNGTKYDLALPGSGTVGQVRSFLQAQTRVPQKRQKLIGLGKKPNPDDRCASSCGSAVCSRAIIGERAPSRHPEAPRRALAFLRALFSSSHNHFVVLLPAKPRSDAALLALAALVPLPCLASVDVLSLL